MAISLQSSDLQTEIMSNQQVFLIPFRMVRFKKLPNDQWAFWPVIPFGGQFPKGFLELNPLEQFKYCCRYYEVPPREVLGAVRKLGDLDGDYLYDLRERKCYYCGDREGIRQTLLSLGIGVTVNS